MEQYILTHIEAKIISTLSNEDETRIYEIAATTRLTPSEVLEVLNHLRVKDLVSLEGNQTVHLTDKGKHVSELMERQGKQRFSGGSGSGKSPVVIVNDEEYTRKSRKFEELEPEALDIALDSELQKLNANEN